MYEYERESKISISSGRTSNLMHMVNNSERGEKTENGTVGAGEEGGGRCGAGLEAARGQPLMLR